MTRELIRDSANYLHTATNKPVFVYHVDDGEFPEWLEMHQEIFDVQCYNLDFGNGSYWVFEDDTTVDEDGFVEGIISVSEFSSEFWEQDESYKPIDEFASYTYLDDFLESAADYQNLFDWLSKQPIFAEMDKSELLSMNLFEVLAICIRAYYYRAPLYSDLTPVKVGGKFRPNCGGCEYFATEVKAIEYETPHLCTVYSTKRENADNYSTPSELVSFEWLPKGLLVQKPKPTEKELFMERLNWSTQKYAKLVLDIPDKNDYTDDEIEIMVRKDILARYEELDFSEPTEEPEEEPSIPEVPETGGEDDDTETDNGDGGSEPSEPSGEDSYLGDSGEREDNIKEEKEEDSESLFE